MDRKKIEEMFRNNPELEEEVELGVDNMNVLAARILQELGSGVKDLEECKGWHISMLMALAKATASVLCGLQHSCTNMEIKNELHALYIDVIFPMVAKITYEELDEIFSEETDTNVN